MGLILVIIAMILKTVLLPIGIIYECLTLMRFSKISDYFRNIAVSIDMTGNVGCQGLFNDTLIDRAGYKFGKPGETISSVLGKNLLSKNLTIVGKILVKILDGIEKNHCIKSITN